MPSIEILAVEQPRATSFEHLPFAVLADPSRRSHRSPSRFQSDFDQLPGVLYHLGNPDLKTDWAGKCFFAYKLLSRESQRVTSDFLEFAPEFRPHVQELLTELLAQSPALRLFFTSDWQFGPDWTKRESGISLDQFWALHDSHRLLLNALYPITTGKGVRIDHELLRRADALAKRHQDHDTRSARVAQALTSAPTPWPARRAALAGVRLYRGFSTGQLRSGVRGRRRILCESHTCQSGDEW